MGKEKNKNICSLKSLSRNYSKKSIYSWNKEYNFGDINVKNNKRLRSMPRNKRTRNNNEVHNIKAYKHTSPPYLIKSVEKSSKLYKSLKKSTKSNTSLLQNTY